MSKEGLDKKKELIFQEKEVTPQFAVGLHLFFEVAHKSQKYRVKANMLGWYRHRFFITTSPYFEKSTMLLAPDTDVVVRYMLDGMVYGFATKVIRKVQDPMPFLIMKYPEVVETKNLRDSPRVQTLLQVKSEDPEPWIILDISYTGALLSVNEDLKIGEKILLSFFLPDGTEIKDLAAVVVRLNYTEREKNAGVRFVEESEQMEQLRAYVSAYEQITKSLFTEFEID